MRATLPKVVIVLQPFNEGFSPIGEMDCPYCGKIHYTNRLGTGHRFIYCPPTAERPDGANPIEVVNVLDPSPGAIGPDVTVEESR